MCKIWKDIEGYEGLYQVSSSGEIRSLSKPYFSDKPNMRPEKTKALRKKKNGYLQVGLYKDGKAKSFTIHRLVAKAFIPNPNNLPYVNHKDENKSNNHCDNLEWCTASYNLHYGNALKKLSISKINHPSKSFPVVQLDATDTVIATYPSANEAEGQTGINQAQISKCCNKNKGYYSAGGFKWRYANEHN